MAIVGRPVRKSAANEQSRRRAGDAAPRGNTGGRTTWAYNRDEMQEPQPSAAIALEEDLRRERARIEAARAKARVHLVEARCILEARFRAGKFGADAYGVAADAIDAAERLVDVQLDWVGYWAERRPFTEEHLWSLRAAASWLVGAVEVANEARVRMASLGEADEEA